ncbi:MAG: hypothetical protein ACKVIQ_14530, partial [Acidimicrobiales bacterium]
KATAPVGPLELNTLPERAQVISLYISMGFECCDPYGDEPLEGVLYRYRLLQPSVNCIER